MNKEDSITREQMSIFEEKTLKYNLIPIFGMAISGLVFGNLANSSAIILDGTFSFVLFMSIIIAQFIAKSSKKPRDNNFPQGRSMFEVMYRLFKSLVLLIIISVGLIDAILELTEYFVNGVVPEQYDPLWGTIYYFTKFVFFSIAFIIVQHNLKKTKFKSKLLKLERLSVITDGAITFSIWFGFTFLSKIKFFEDISDAVILLFMTIFLFYIISKEFKEEFYLIMGKRNNTSAEDKYKMIFKIDQIVRKIDILDMVIIDNGKLTTVSITAKFDHKLYSYEIAEIQHEIKEIMKLEYGVIFLYTYWE